MAAVAAVRADASFLGYERSPTRVAEARARGIDRATFALFDLALDRPPPARGRVDVVVAPFVLGAQPEDGALFTHLRRLLRDGGLLLAIEPDEVAGRSPLTPPLSPVGEREPGPESTARRVVEILVRRGFSIESCDPLEGTLVGIGATPDPARAQPTAIRGWD